jgi:S1-C subfamily serine protease
LAEAVFVVEPASHVEPVRPRPRLGVLIETGEGGVRIAKVVEGSVAEETKLATGDIVVSAAGVPIKRVSDLIEIVQRQAPGTWLPLKIRRNDEDIEVVAKFPTKFESPE